MAMVLGGDSGIDVFEVLRDSTITIEDNIIGGFLFNSPVDGQADAGSGATTLIDATADSVAAGVLVGDTIYNLSDPGSSAVITVVTAETPDTLTFGALSGGTADTFAEGDDYLIAFHLEGNNRYGVNVRYTDFGSDATITNNIVSENGWDGIFLEYVGYMGSTAQAYYDLFLVYGANIITIEGNVAGSFVYGEGAVVHSLGGNGSGNDGIYLSYVNFATEIVIRNNVANGNGDDGINLEYLGTESCCSGASYFWNSSTNAPEEQYPLYYGPVALVDSNTMNANATYGFHQYDSWQAGTDVTISNNTMSGNGSIGLNHCCVIEYGSTVTDVGNTITGNVDAGISLQDNVQLDGHITIIDNVVSDNGSDGIYLTSVTGAGSSASITDNTISNNDADGIDTSSTGVTAGAALDISDNTISGNGGDGIILKVVDDDTSATIAGNTIDGNTDDGVEFVQADIGSAVFVGPLNTITNNGDAGVLLSAISDGVSVVVNTINDNAVGVWVEGDDNGIGRNDIRRNTASSASGIHLTDSAADNLIRANNIIDNDTEVGGFGVFRETTSNDTVDARFNFWGNATGPTHPSNPGGTGDTASFFVDFSEFATALIDIDALLNDTGTITLTDENPGGGGLFLQGNEVLTVTLTDGDLSGGGNIQVGTSETVILTGTANAGTSTYLRDSVTYPFPDAGVQAGDRVFNLTDGSSSFVDYLFSNYRVYLTPALSGGFDNTFQSGDQFLITRGGFDLTLTETDVDGVFTGSFRLVTDVEGTDESADPPQLEARVGQTVAVIYDDANDASGSDPDPVRATLVPLGFWNFPLAIDWNLISLPLIPTDDAGLVTDDIEVVAASILDSADSIWSWDSLAQEWSAFFPDDPLASDLVTMETLRGYFVFMDEEDILEGQGLELLPGPELPPSIELMAGAWNLIGFKTMDFDRDGELIFGDGDRSSGDALNGKAYLRQGGIFGTHGQVYYSGTGPFVSQMRTFDGSSGVFDGVALGESKGVLTVGRGYWLFLSGNAPTTTLTPPITQRESGG